MSDNLTGKTDELPNTAENGVGSSVHFLMVTLFLAMIGIFVALMPHGSGSIGEKDGDRGGLAIVGRTSSGINWDALVRPVERARANGVKAISGLSRDGDTLTVFLDGAHIFSRRRNSVTPSVSLLFQDLHRNSTAAFGNAASARITFLPGNAGRRPVLSNREMVTIVREMQNQGWRVEQVELSLDDALGPVSELRVTYNSSVRG